MSSIIKVDTIQDQDGNNIINENANTITIGKSGDTVTVASGATFVGGGIEWQSSIVTGTTLSAVAGKGYWIDTTSNTCTITLPSSANVGDQLIFSDYARTWNTNKIIIDSNGLNYQGDPDTLTVEYNTNGQTVNIVYSGATKGWIPISDDDVTDAPTLPPYSVDFLVIAGGGSGGTYRAGGGGAGGYRTSTQTVNSGTVITVTVGDGGAGVTGISNSGAGAGISGSDSSISGSGLTTITSSGGGGGGTAPPNLVNGKNGGSGGGAGGGATAGTGNTPSTSPSQGTNGGAGNNSAPNYGAGGGGGASVAGANASNTSGTNGGAGTSSSITGSAVTRAGGGAGGGMFSAPSTTGGAGGGGDAPSNSNGTAGTANTGGGGGGTNSTNDATPHNSGAGGKGVVILSVPTASYSGTTTGSPTVTTKNAGADTVLQFNGSGTYTA